MKGIGPIALMIIVVLALLIVSGGIMNVALFRTESMTFTLKDIFIISEINKVESFKVGLPYMAQYSFCHALYSVSENGGCYPSEKEKCEFWRKQTSTFFPSDYRENIVKLINITANDYLKNYLKSKEEIYTLVNVKDRINIPLENSERGGLLSNEGVEINLFSDKLIHFASSFLQLTFNISPNVTGYYPTYMSRMYGCGKKWFVDGDIIHDVANSVFDELAKECKVYEVGDVCENKIQEVAETHSCLDSFKSNVLTAVKDLTGGYSKTCVKTGSKFRPTPLHLSIEIKDSSFSYSVSFKYSSKKENSQDCDCKKYDDKGNCIERYDKLIDVKIIYTYVYELEAGVTITDQHNYCPLYGEYKFIKLKFRVISSGEFKGSEEGKKEEITGPYLLCTRCILYPDDTTICECEEISKT